MIVLFDLDGFVYKAGFAGESKTRTIILKDTGEPLGVLSKGERVKDWCENSGYAESEIEVQVDITPDDVGHVLHTAKSLITSVLTKFNTDKFEGYLTGEGNFRDGIYPDYKANRRGAPKPFHYNAIRNYYIQRFNAEVVDGKEADDAVSIANENYINKNEQCVMVSTDKDFNTIPGLHYNPDTDKVQVITPFDADLFFYSQLLAGDTADNIPGIKGVGMKIASGILADCDTDEDLYTTCAAVYHEHYGDEWADIMHRNAKLLYLLRHEEDEWQPPLILDIGNLAEASGT